MADSVVIRIKGEDSGFKEALSSAASTAKSFGSTASKALAGVTKATAALSAAAAAAGVSCLQVGMQFEAAMSQVQAISGASAADMERLTQVAKDYGASTSFSATEAANALNYMALAGWNTQQSIDALGGVLNLAAASGMDLATASDMVTDYLSAFGMAASDATYMADLMAFAQSKSNTSAQALGEAYGNCAASMHAAGQDIETTTAALMVLANQGLKGSEAGTAMSAVMRDLTDKMENGKVMIGNTAVAVQDAQGNFRDLNDIMADVAAATAGMGTAEASAALMTTFTARSVKAVQMLMAGGIDAVNEYEDALRGAEGTAAEQSEIMLDNLQGDITIFKSALEGLQISASEAMSGTARELVQAGTELMNALNEGAKKGGIEGIANAFIDQIPTLVDKAVGMISQLMSGVAKKLPALIKKLVGTLPEMLSGALTLAPELVDALFEGATALVTGLIERLPELVPTLITGIGNLLSSALSGVLKLGASIITVIGELITGSLGDSFQEAWDSIATDKEYEAQLKVGLNTEVDTSGAEGSVETAYENVRKLLRGPLLTEEQRSEILSMIGGDYQAVYDKLISFGLPPEQAATLAKAVSDAGATVTSEMTKAGLTEAQQSVVLGKINDGYTAVYDALVGFGVPEPQAAELAAAVMDTGMKVARDMNDKLGLTDKQIEIISTKIDDGYQAVYDTLVGFGIPEGTASTVAQSLIDFSDDLKSRFDGMDLSVDTGTLTKWVLQAKGNRTTFIGLLQASGQLSNEEITSITNVFDDLTGQITGSLPNVVSEIYQTLTDGNLENDDPEALKKKVQEALTAEFAAIDEWLDGEIAKLDSTSAGYDAQVAALTEQADGYKATVTELAAGMDTLIDECAYARSETVQQRMTEFAEIEARAQGVIDMLDAAHGKYAGTGNMQWDLVTRGATTNAENIGIAQAYSRSTYDQQIAQIEQTATELRAQADAAWTNGWASEGAAGEAKYNAAEQAINAWVAAETAQVLAEYQTRGSQLMQGVIGAFSYLPGMGSLGTVGDLASYSATLNEIWDFVDNIPTNYNWSDEKGQAMIAAVQSIADAMGLANDIDLPKEINGDNISHATGLLLAMISGENGMLATAVNELESNPEALGQFKAAVTGLIEAGIIEGVSAADVENMGIDQLLGLILNGGGTGADSNPEALSQLKTTVTGLIEAGIIEGVEAADVENMGIDQLLGLILNGGEGVEVEPEVDLTPPTIEGLPEVTETVSEATQSAAESGGSAVEAQPEVSVTPTVTVEDVETSGSSGLQKDVEKELSSQKMKVNVSADVTLKVSVSDSNGAEVGRAAGEEIGEAIGEGIEAKDSAAQSAGSALASSAKTGARSGRSAMRTAGVYVGEGFNAGLRSKKSDILRTAEEIANAVSAKLREAFQINSPSHVTQRIGESVGEGLDLGMRESIGAAIRNAENIVGMMDLRVRDPMAGVTESLTGAADRLAEASSRSMAVYLNGRQVGRALERDIPAVVSSNTRHINLGVGKA